MKTKKVVSLLLGAVMILSAFAGCSSSKQSSGSGSEPVKMKIAFSTWVGYGPLYIAQEKGMFKKYGVDPELTVIQDESTYAASLLSNAVQAEAHVLDRTVLDFANGTPLTTVFAMDQSLGGDGIIATGDIKTVADLKGKSVALDKSSTSYFFFLSVLKKNGVSESDLTVKDMQASDAGTAFVSGKIDAAVVWEPWLTNSNQREGGHVLVSSKDYPNTIVDEVVFNNDFISKHPDAVKGFVKAWYEAVDYYKSNPEDGIKIMAKGLDIKEDEFKDMVKGVQYYGKEENKSFFDKRVDDNIFAVTKRAADFWAEKKLIKESFEPEKMVSSDFYAAE